MRKIRNRYDKMMAEYERGMDAARVTPLRKIMFAKTKPEGVSDIRWRMELRRRANPFQFELTHMPVGGGR